MKTQSISRTAIRSLSPGDVFSYEAYAGGDDLWMKCVDLRREEDGTCTVVNLLTGLVVPNATDSLMVLEQHQAEVKLW